MCTIKNLIPVFTLLILSFYAYHRYFEIPDSIINGIIFLPVILAMLAIGLSIHFNRSTVFFYTLIVVFLNIVLGLKLAGLDLSYALLSVFIPIMILVVTIIPERGVLSIKAMPVYTILIVSFVFSIIIINISPPWAMKILLVDWMPGRYFDWTSQSQTVFIISVVSIIYMLVLYFVRPSTNTAAGLGILITMIIQLHYGEVSRSLNIFSSSALMLCLYAVMQESWRMAYLDELTELPARRALKEKFQKLSGPFSIAMVDVDHFKKFNDRYGHDTGDAVLRMIATKLQKVTGGGISYRYGGEEFAIVFTNRCCDDAEEHLEILRNKIAEAPFVINRVNRRKGDRKIIQKKAKSVTVTVSIGFSKSNGEESSPWDVLKLADKALYRAKNKGRNCLSS